jgi:Ca2+-binding RTX toxin-like protein
VDYSKGGYDYSTGYNYHSTSSKDSYTSRYNETGNYGYYYLDTVTTYSGTLSSSSGLKITSYYDSESKTTTTPAYTTTGTSGLGSESAYLTSNYSTTNDYITTYYEADKVSSSSDDNSDDNSSDSDASSYTLDDLTDSYKTTSSGTTRLVISGSDKNKSWALWGGDNNDTLTGGNKDDVLIGGKGTDYLKGGRGSDTFVMTDWEDKKFDFIKDFSSKDDLIGISSYMMDVSDDASVEVVKYKDIKNKKTAEETFDDADADVYVLMGSTKQIAKVKSEGWSENILLAIDTKKKIISYDEDGNWKGGSQTLAKFTGKMSRSWSGDNFEFGLDTVLG